MGKAKEPTARPPAAPIVVGVLALLIVAGGAGSLIVRDLMRAETPEQVALAAEPAGGGRSRVKSRPMDRPSIKDPSENLGDDIADEVPVPTMTREEMKALGYTPADEMEPLAPEPPTPEPPPPVEPPEPSLFRPPMHNPGGVDGDRPPRPIPGISDAPPVPAYPARHQPPPDVEPPYDPPAGAPPSPNDDPTIDTDVDPATAGTYVDPSTAEQPSEE